MAWGFTRRFICDHIFRWGCVTWGSPGGIFVTTSSGGGVWPGVHQEVHLLPPLQVGVCGLGFTRRYICDHLFRWGCVACGSLGGTFVTTSSGGGVWPGVHQEMKFMDVMPGVYLRDTPVRLRLVRLEPLPASLHIFNQYK